MSAIELKPPKAFKKYLKTKPSIFLAGSIEQDTAVDWQTKTVNFLKSEDVIILNPRRDDWDSSWKQTIENEQFRTQVLWELEGQRLADVIAMYFDPKTKSPITLLELGMFADTRKLIVYCPKEFWRRGNVEIVCALYKIPIFENELEWANALKSKLRTLI